MPPPSSGVAWYDDEVGAVRVAVHASADVAAFNLAGAVYGASEAAISLKGSFTLVVAGGSVPAMLSGLLSHDPPPKWDKFHVFFVDERVVPHDSPESSLRAMREAVLGKAPIPVSQVHAIKEGASPREAACDYAAQMAALPTSVLPRNDAGFPVFDLMLLGMGPDGHVASLFPGHASLRPTEAWVLEVLDSPKPPPERITMSMPVINAAKDIIFVALGSGKANILPVVVNSTAPGSRTLPAQMVRLQAGRVKWFLDAASASKLGVENWSSAAT